MGSTHDTATVLLGRDQLFVDVVDGCFELRSRGVAAQLLELTAVGNLGAQRVRRGEWRAPISARDGVAALAAEARAVVLPAAARELGAPMVTRLTGSLTPQPLWGSGPPEWFGDRWDEMRALALGAAESRCDGCGRHAGHVEVALEYDDDTGVASATRLLVLCEGCELVVHHGLARVTGREEIALGHAAALNGWPPGEASGRWLLDSEEWSERSDRDWRLDVSAFT